MKNRVWAACFVLALVSIAPTAAYAQQPAGTPAGSGTADEQQAQKLSDDGYAAYEKGDFPKAIEAYMASYKLVPTADILYNVARIYDQKLNESKLAVEFYRRYNAAPDAKPELVGKSTARIAALSGPANGGAPAGDNGAAAGPAASEDRGDSGKTLRTVGIITGIVGIAGLGLGGVTGLIASGKHDDSGCSGDVCPTQAGVEKEKDAGTMATVSTVSFIAGGVLLATGIVLYLVAPKSSEKRTGYLLPNVGVAGASGMNAGFRF